MASILHTRAAKVAVLIAGLAMLLPQGPGAEERSTEDVTPPRVIEKSRRAPVFPPAAKAARFQGRVTVRVTVLPTGVPANLLVIDSSHPKVGFEEAAIAAIEQWRFIPALYRGVPVEYETQYRLTFGRHGVAVAGGSSMSAVQSRNDAANSAAQPPAKPTTNTRASSRNIPSRR